MDTVEGALERQKDIWAALLADGRPDGVAPLAGEAGGGATMAPPHHYLFPTSCDGAR